VTWFQVENAFIHSLTDACFVLADRAHVTERLRCHRVQNGRRSDEHRSMPRDDVHDD